MRACLLSLIFLFLTFVLHLQAQDKGDYWFYIEQHKTEIGEARELSGLSNSAYQELNYQSLVWRGGWYWQQEYAVGGHFQLEQSADFTAFKEAISNQKKAAHQNRNIDADLYVRYSFKPKKRYISGLEAGLYGAFYKRKGDAREFYFPTNTISFYDSNRFRRQSLGFIANGFWGLKINPSLNFLLHLNTKISLFEAYQDEGEDVSSRFDLEFYRLGLSLGLEYYFSASQRKIASNFIVPYSKMRFWGELNGTLFASSFADGLDADWALGIQNKKGLSIEFWIRYNTEDWNVPLQEVNTIGLAIEQSFRLSKAKKYYNTWGARTERLQIGEQAPGVQTGIYTQFDFWYQNRLRLTAGATYQVFKEEQGAVRQHRFYQWLAHAELEYFIAPNFSWLGRIELPVSQVWRADMPRSTYSRERYRGDFTEVAARFWF